MNNLAFCKSLANPDTGGNSNLVNVATAMLDDVIQMKEESENQDLPSIAYLSEQFKLLYVSKN